MEAFVKTSIENNIGFITFFHPASNSFPAVQLQNLVQALNQLSANKDCHVIILQSIGKTFCAGASFDELLAVSNLNNGKVFFSGFANVINAIRKNNKIVIGKIQGKAVGGGLGIAAACDYALATEDAAVKLSEFTIGIGPFVIEPAVTRKIGLSAMAALTLNATNWQSASWAYEKGLYASLHKNTEELEEATITLANNLASYNPKALEEYKKVMWQNTENWDTLLAERAAISGALVLSDFTKKALAKLKN
jgi:methylglutaconyl-CoA hydratase